MVRTGEGVGGVWVATQLSVSIRLFAPLFVLFLFVYFQLIIHARTQ